MRPYRIKQRNDGYIVQVYVEFFGIKIWYAPRFGYLESLGSQREYIYLEPLYTSAIASAKEQADIWLKEKEIIYKGFHISPIATNDSRTEVGYYIQEWAKYYQHIDKYGTYAYSLRECKEMVDKEIAANKKRKQSKIVYESTTK